jgi:hypothetical protein
VRPTLEGLEDRKLLYATLGDAWTMPIRVTYSFVPDGTSVLGSTSNLYSTMSSQGVSQAAWQQAFQEAAAIWEMVANVNLVLVSDDGTAISGAGNQQGDSRFGDIRISAMSLPSGTLAGTFAPPPDNGGTLAGDIVVNSSVLWNSYGYDLPTVAIHELGHALGMDHSTLTYAQMYAYYTGAKNILAADDIAGIQSIYGARPADRYDAQVSNNSPYTATDFSGFAATGQGTITGLDISSNSDPDWYKVTVPANTNGTMTVTMQSTGLSSLNPRLYLHNSSFQILSTAYVPGAYGATVSLTLTGVSPNQVYYVRCTSAAGGVTGVGAYGLQLNFTGGSMAPIAPPVTTVAQQPNSDGSWSLERKGPPGRANAALAAVADRLDNLPSNAVAKGLQKVLGQVDHDNHFITIGNVTARGDFLMAAPGFQPNPARDWTINLFANPNDGGTSVPLVTTDAQLVSPLSGTTDKAAKARNSSN